MIAFIQARMGSKRLPGKMALQLPDDKTLLEAVINRLVVHDVFPVLLTTQNSEDDKLVEIANSLEIRVFRGDEINVLSRFTKACDEFGVAEDDFVLRVCADNPYLSHYIIDQTLLACKISPNKDYISFGYNGIPGIKYHTGIFVEAVKFGALQSLLYLNNNCYNEHVTMGLYKNPKKYDIQIFEIPVEWHSNFEKIRLTIDDVDDWNFCLQTYPLLSPLDFSEQQNLLLSNKNWINLMKNQIIKNQK